jgi:hypothetical protein
MSDFASEEFCFVGEPQPELFSDCTHLQLKETTGRAQDVQIHYEFQRALDERLFAPAHGPGVGLSPSKQTSSANETRCPGDAAAFLILARSLDKKKEILDTALASYDGSAITQVCLWLRATLPPAALASILAARPRAASNLSAYYRRRKKLTLLLSL